MGPVSTADEVAIDLNVVDDGARAVVRLGEKAQETSHREPTGRRGEDREHGHIEMRPEDAGGFSDGESGPPNNWLPGLRNEQRRSVTGGDRENVRRFKDGRLHHSGGG